MSEKTKSIFGKLIDTADKTRACIYIDFSSNEDAQINVIKKNEKSAEINDDDNKALTLLLSDIHSQFRQQGISLNRVQGQPEGKRNLTAGLKTDKASLSETEVALQKMQFRAQELGAELVLTDRPAEMANERWRLPEASGQENRSEGMTAAEGLAKLAVAVQAVTDQCPLQITLMIQPDLRPQVTLNVSAGEVNWRFAAKEGRYPLKDLLAKMAGKTTTHGWDAVVVYQRGQANMLLKQQHIKRFITGNVLAPLNEDIDSSDATRLQTHNLTLSAPHLSFDAAGAADSMAQVGWDFVKGMIVFTQEADDGSYRVKKIEKITPLNSPFIGMKVPLSRASGSVSEIGEVQFDIKEGDHFTNNLVVNGMGQEMISNFFKRRFVATPDDQRIYKLGTISNYEHEQFQPEEFEIRTMGAPNTASRGSQDEGDGAVVLFVQMKGSNDRPMEKKIDWLLTDGYTSAMVVSNNQVFDNIKVRDDDFPVTFKKYRIGNDSDSLWGVKAVGGKYNGEYSYRDAFEYVNIRIDYKIKFKFKFEFEFEFEFSESEQVKEIYKLYPAYMNPGDKNEVVNKYEIFSNNVGIEVDSWYVKDNGEEGHHYVVNGSAAMKLIIDLWYMATVGLDEGNDIGLVNSNENLLKAIKTEFSDVDFPSIGVWDVFVGFLNRYVPKLLDGYINEELKSDICDHFYKYNFQLLNTFVLGNLLFPGSNYFHSELAHLPGDLLVEGQLAPGSESFAVTPAEITIVAGSEYQFTTTPEVSGIKWSLSDSEKDNTGADLGHIDAVTGKYTAPQAGTITEGVRHVVVCAEKGDTKVYALASVLAHSVNISPAYQVILPGKSSALTAESLNGGELTWTLADNAQNSTLTKVSNNEYTYTAGKKNKKLKLNLERVSVADITGTTTEAMILVRNVPLTGYIRASYDNMPENSVQLTYFSDPDVAESAIPAEDTVWTVLESGGATLDNETGILSCSQPTDDGFAVISTKYSDEDEGALYCAIAIPLPPVRYRVFVILVITATELIHCNKECIFELYTVKVMKNKSKGIFGKFIDITDESGSGININFVSHQDVRLNIIEKENKSADVKKGDSKELTSLLSDIKSHLKKAGVPLTITQNDTEKNTTVTTGQHLGKAALSDAEIALQKMQFRAQELGAELVLTDRPAEMANERWRLPEASGQENRSEGMTAAEGLAQLAVAVQAVTDQCPLQITLMIQPDLRPQVMLNVSAGEVNWRFAAKEGRYPLKDLLAKMAGKATTHGWDAVVVYQRGQANMLLKQQHIKRFITGNVLAPLNENIESSDATRLQTHNLTLSAPHLSFDGAGTGDSMAQVGWDFVKGMIIFTQEADDGSYRVKKIEKITPLNSPFIGMKVPLSRAPGSVSEIGEVQFDIKEGDHFTNNLVVNDIEQDTISGFFKRWFEAAPDDQRIYKLGTISNYEHEQFQPEEFKIRTMGAPNTASRGSQDEGDGAVVLFVQMKDSDSEPGKTEADWLLADNYSSALVVSGYQLFDKLIREQSMRWLGGNIKFDSYLADTGNAGKLQAITGVIHHYSYFYFYFQSDPDYPYIRTNGYLYTDLYKNKAGSVIVPLTLRSSYSENDKDDICCEYKFSGIIGSIINDIYVNAYGHQTIVSCKDDFSEPFIDFLGRCPVSVYFKAIYSPVINDDVVNFVYNPSLSIYQLLLGEHECIKGCDGLNPDAVSTIIKLNSEKIKSKFIDELKYTTMDINLNGINTFTFRNLLFPGENYFRMQHARVPGDLLALGHLGAGSESFAVTPTETTIVAGSDYQFTITPEVSGVKWSISDSEKGNTGVDLGHIDAVTGKYTAPQAGTITEGVRHVVVCAEKGDTKVYAQASVLAHSVNISPAYQVILPGKSSALTAESLNSGELIWTLADNAQNSTLTKVSNNEYTYTAGKKNKKLKLNLERVSVADITGATTEAMILVRNVPLTGYIRVSYANVPENSVQLTYFSDPDDAESAIPADDIEWTVLESGGATLDPETGILSCNQPTDNGFAVISTKYPDEDEGALYCAIAIPLPLNTYKETILAAYSPEQS